jgi:hypothetical protein
MKLVARPILQSTFPIREKENGVEYRFFLLYNSSVISILSDIFANCRVKLIVTIPKDICFIDKKLEFGRFLSDLFFPSAVADVGHC